MSINKATKNLRLSSKWQMGKNDEWKHSGYENGEVFHEVIVIHVCTKNEVSCENYINGNSERGSKIHNVNTNCNLNSDWLHTSLTLIGVFW